MAACNEAYGSQIVIPDQGSLGYLAKSIVNPSRHVSVVQCRATLPSPTLDLTRSCHPPGKEKRL